MEEGLCTSGNTDKDEDHSDGGGPTDIMGWCGPSCGPIMAEEGPLEESLLANYKES